MREENQKLEEALVAAQLSQDANFFESVLAEGFHFTTPQGQLVTKSQDIEQYRNGSLKLHKVQISERTIDLFGETGIVRLRAKFEGQAGAYPFSSDMILTRVYVLTGEGLKMVAGHGSNFTAPTTVS